MSKKNIAFTDRREMVGKYLFHLCEADSDEYFRSYKDGDNYELIIFADAVDTETGELMATYSRYWETANSSTGDVFAEKFLTDADYREQYRVSGTRLDDVLPPQKELVNRKCAENIKRLCAKNPKSLRFRDFAQLKTYGRDKVSTMKLNELTDVISDTEMTGLKESVNEEYILPVLRWCKRGLPLDFAIRKVKADVEISQNAMSSKLRW